MGSRRGDMAKEKFYRIIDDKWELEKTLKQCFEHSKRMTRQKLLEKYSKEIVREMEEKYSKEIAERNKNAVGGKVPTT